MDYIDTIIIHLQNANINLVYILKGIYAKIIARYKYTEFK